MCSGNVPPVLARLPVVKRPEGSLARFGFNLSPLPSSHTHTQAVLYHHGTGATYSLGADTLAALLSLQPLDVARTWVPKRAQVGSPPLVRPLDAAPTPARAMYLCRESPSPGRAAAARFQLAPGDPAAPSPTFTRNPPRPARPRLRPTDPYLLAQSNRNSHSPTRSSSSRAPEEVSAVPVRPSSRPLSPPFPHIPRPRFLLLTLHLTPHRLALLRLARCKGPRQRSLA